MGEAPPGEALGFAAFGVTASVRGPRAIVARVESDLGFLARIPPDRARDLRYEVRDGVVTESGTVLGPVPPTAPPAEVVCDHFHFALAERATDALFVHAGAVAWRGHGIAVPGASHSGKSTLVAALAAAGAAYFSDEYAVLTDDGTLLPYPRPLRLRVGAGRTDLPASTLGPPADPAGVPLAVVLATPFGGTTRVTTVQGSRAVLPLLDNTVRARHEARRLVTLGARLADRVTAVIGERGDAAPAATALLAIVDDLLEARAEAPAATP